MRKDTEFLNFLLQFFEVVGLLAELASMQVLFAFRIRLHQFEKTRFATLYPPWLITTERIRVYLHPSNTPQTRDVIFNEIEPLKSICRKIVKNFERLVDDFVRINEARLYRNVSIATLRTYALYEVLDDQFNDNDLYVISERDIEQI